MTVTDLLWLIPILPLLGAVINGGLALGGAKTVHGPARGFVALIAVLMPALAFVLTCLAASAINDRAAQVNGGFLHQVGWTWFAFGGYELKIGLLFDRLSSLMLLFITGIGTLIHLYSVGYMWEDRGFARFMAYLNLFMASMIILVLGDSLPAAFLGWEGVGLCSYLLIGFWHQNDAYNDAARKAFVVNRVGDLGFLLGMFALVAVCGHLDYRGIQAFFQDPANAAAISAGKTTIIAAALLLFIGACGKSAQIPLQTWLPDAMAGPTPVSALIHAATMVTSGVYLLARLCDVYITVPEVLTAVLCVGALTAVWGAIAGLFQHDIKKALAYSTVSQLGFMFMACGVGAFDVALFHVFTHAFFKAALFLGSGAVIHGLHHEQDMRRMGGLSKKLIVAHMAMGYGWYAIIGGPLAAGFWSKDLILDNLFSSHVVLGGVNLGLIVFWLAIATACVTVVYMTRVMFLTFWSPSRVAPEVEKHIHGTPITMAIPLVILAFGSLIAGFLWIPDNLFMVAGNKGGNLFQDWLSPVLAGAQQELARVKGVVHDPSHHEVVTFGMQIGSALIALVFVILAAVLYRKGPAGGAPAAGVSSDPTGFGAFWTWMFDKLYDVAIVKPLTVLGLLTYWIVELATLSGLTMLTGWIQSFLGEGFAAAQRSRLRTGLALSVGGAAVILIIVILMVP